MNLRALNILPLISIIIPLYNTEKFILDCISSIESQAVDFSLIEVLVVDDCSTDSSLETILGYETNIELVIDKLSKNGGPGIARNRGLLLAKGKYILFLDADDRLYPGSLATLINIITNYDYDLIAYNWTYMSDIEESGQPVKRRRDLASMPTQRDKITEHYLGMNMDGSVIYTLAGKELFSSYNIEFPAGFHEDMSVIFKIYYAAKKIHKLDKVLYIKRSVEGSIVNSLTINHISGYLGAWPIISNFLEDQGLSFKDYEPSYLRGMSGHVYTLITKIRKTYPDEVEARINFYRLIIKNLEKDKNLYRPYQKLFPKESNKDTITHSFFSMMRGKGYRPSIERLKEFESILPN